MNDNVFLIVWDDLGLEAVVYLNEVLDNNNLLTEIRDSDKQETTKTTMHSPIFFWRLRARYNSRRNYELYVINTEPEITTNDMIELFENNPKVAKDLIKEKGHKLGY